MKHRHTSLAMILAAAAQCVAGTTTFVDRQDPNDLRVVSYNIWFDHIFDTSSTGPERFARVVQALDPDVLNLQEVYDHSAEEVAALMNTIQPLATGFGWHAFRHTDNVILSKYPMFLSGGFGFGTAAALIDLPNDTFDRDLFVVNDHWACCDQESIRQQEADQTVKLLEFTRTPGSGVPQGTPTVVLGDLNIVGSGQPLQTVITGDIIDEGTYGSDSPPDWDGTSLTNALPPHNGTRSEVWTWRSDADVFDPGTLDYILYTDSVMHSANKFVLNTTTMLSSELAATGLERNDVVINEATGFFDHLPVVVDFRLEPIPEPSTALLALLVVAAWRRRV